MKKMSGIEAFKSKRIVSGFSFRGLGTVLLFMLLLPYIITILFGNLTNDSGYDLYEEVDQKLAAGTVLVINHTSLGQEKLPIELYVADELAGCVEEDCEPEALKAQAVLIRTNLLLQGEQAGNIHKINVYDEDYGRAAIGEEIWKAVTQTAGVGLFYQGKPVYGAYFAVSGGTTRDGEELLNREYPYLKSVPCKNDFLSDDFISSECLNIREFKRIWKLIPRSGAGEAKGQEYSVDTGQDFEEIKMYRDEAGYVLYVEYEDKVVSGEQFREAYHLASAGFAVSRLGEQVMITVTGVGHGFGMSRFEANEMAKEGKDYVEILNYFFQDVTITKIE